MSRNLETWEGGWVCPGPCLRRAGGVLSGSLATSGGCAALPRPVLRGASAEPPDPCEAPEERRGEEVPGARVIGGEGVAQSFRTFVGRVSLGIELFPPAPFAVSSEVVA